jgi:hypothetical protein
MSSRPVHSWRCDLRGRYPRRPRDDYTPAVTGPGTAIAGESRGPAGPTAGLVTEALRTVIDPELGLSVVELGLIYGIAIEGGTVRITMT